MDVSVNHPFKAMVRSHFAAYLPEKAREQFEANVPPSSITVDLRLPSLKAPFVTCIFQARKKISEGRPKVLKYGWVKAGLRDAWDAEKRVHWFREGARAHSSK